MKRISERDDCPICRTNYVEADYTPNDGYWFECKICGKYEISESAIPGLPMRVHKHHLLQAFIRQENQFERSTPKINTTWESKVEHLRHTSIRQRQDKLLRLFRQRAEFPGEFAAFDVNTDWPLCDSRGAGTAAFLVEDLIGRKLIRTNKTSAMITVEGWDYLDPLSGGAPHTAFVAMSFHPELDQAYQEGILPALRDDCGKTVIRIKEEQFRELITDRIIAEIRRARIVVADMTKQRQNVYFEAGFAMGMDRLVVFTCRRDEEKEIHFDTNQYQHILWDTPADLREQLGNRIKRLGA
jgi:hypothetical protein